MFHIAHYQLILSPLLHSLFFISLQASVECLERGQALAHLRKRYATLLSRVPQHVRRLHDELVATRTLSRRVLAEMTRLRDGAHALLDSFVQTQQDSDALAKAGAAAAVCLTHEGEGMLYFYVWVCG